ncbi:hypothetical protein GCM10008955_02190 [Deinococcus malanensis]|uniref:Uncharacterized protein n=1 Tax=Deinococcus malanensis TaxID=1706855 RepID=A0ABQ2ELT7_9DEIO|nr:hypothetical protein GCM10008955_02190 [Deinococcus malanensis]
MLYEQQGRLPAIRDAGMVLLLQVPGCAVGHDPQIQNVEIRSRHVGDCTPPGAHFTVLLERFEA